MGTYFDMISPSVTRFVGPIFGAALGVAGAVLTSAAIPIASAEPCPDVQVVFARGTGEDPGVGPTGQTFVDEIRARATRVVVVDMGWPSDDREYADIATFGASRLVGRALSAYFAGRSA